MEQTRSWFNRFQPRADRLKGAVVSKKNGSTGSDSGKETTSQQKSPRAGAGAAVPVPVDELPSNITRQKVAAAKQYIENHYKSQMKNLQERKIR
jgi:serine/threonine kinase 38